MGKEKESKISVLLVGTNPWRIAVGKALLPEFRVYAGNTLTPSLVLRSRADALVVIGSSDVSNDKPRCAVDVYKGALPNPTCYLDHTGIDPGPTRLGVKVLRGEGKSFFALMDELKAILRNLLEVSGEVRKRMCVILDRDEWPDDIYGKLSAISGVEEIWEYFPPSLDVDEIVVIGDARGRLANEVDVYSGGKPIVYLRYSEDPAPVKDNIQRVTFFEKSERLFLDQITRLAKIPASYNDVVPPKRRERV